LTGTFANISFAANVVEVLRFVDVHVEIISAVDRIWRAYVWNRNCCLDATIHGELVEPTMDIGISVVVGFA
jgi:hypothetical protein